MQLSSFDSVVVLSVDYRYNEEHERVKTLLENNWAKSPSFFVNGRGEQLAALMYDQLNFRVPPEGWIDGNPAFQQFRAIKKIVSQAKQAGNRSLLFVEDDVVLADDFQDVVGRARVPGDWDMIYYGANHSEARTKQVAPNVLKVVGSTCTHLVGIKSTMFDEIISLPTDRTMDLNIANRLHDRFNCYAIFPAVATQSPGYSYLWKRPVDYSALWANRGLPL